MGEKVTIRPRGRGCCVADGNAVSITEPRVKFVEGSLDGVIGVKCGDGTRNSILVTVDQLSEIYYRVKDAEFTQGSFSWDAFGDTAEISVTTGVPPTALVTLVGDSAGDHAVSARGFCAIENVVSPNEPLDEYGAGYFGATYYITNQWENLAVRDIGINERAMWANGSNTNPKSDATYGSFWSGSVLLGGAYVGYADLVAPFRTGFNQTFTDYFAYPTVYGIWSDTSYFDSYSETSLNIGDKVVFIDTTGSGDPYDSGNSLYISIYSDAWVGDGGGTGVLYLSSIEDDSGFFPNTNMSAGINLTLELSNSVTVSCPLYFDEDIIPDGGFGYTIAGTDFIIEATEWWPYADNAGLPAWDSTTGLTVNGGAGG